MSSRIRGSGSRRRNGGGTAISTGLRSGNWNTVERCSGKCMIMALAAAQPLALALAALCGRDLPPSFAGFFAGLWSLLPAFAALTVGCAVFVVFAGALATRLGASSVTAAVALAVVSAFVYPLRAVLPDINRFWLVDRLANGGSLGWPEVLPVLAAGLLLIVFWLAVGAILLNRRELP